MNINEEIKKVLIWFEEEGFEKCETYEFDCFQCQSWRMHNEIKAYFELIEEMED